MTQKIQLQEAFKLALSMMLFYWLALTMDWDLPKFGALAIVVISLSTTGASLNKGIMRVAGTGLGALAGFVLLSWFSQSPIGMLLATAVWLVFVGYFLQTTRQGDTWFNAGMLAVAVWSSSYMRVDTAFHFATTRFLETAAGVLLFTVVSVLLWPRSPATAGTGILGRPAENIQSLSSAAFDGIGAARNCGTTYPARRGVPATTGHTGSCLFRYAARGRQQANMGTLAHQPPRIWQCTGIVA